MLLPDRSRLVRVVRFSRPLRVDRLQLDRFRLVSLPRFPMRGRSWAETALPARFSAVSSGILARKLSSKVGWF